MAAKSQIRKIREQLGLTRKQVAALCKVPIRNVEKWERATDPHISTLKKLSQGLGISIDILAGK